MNSALLPSLAATGFAIAFFHAALPTHWLPFVLAGRGQRWGYGKTLSVTLISGGAHVVFTALLGALLVWLGLETSRWTGEVFAYVASAALFAFGFYYLLAPRGGHRHLLAPFRRRQRHGRHGAGVGTPDGATAFVSDRAVIVGLLATLTFSPCEGFLPVYLAGIGYGLAGFLLLSMVLTGATLAGMVIFTSLALMGLERLKIATLERYENRILGALLCFLGLLVLVFERW